MTWRDSAVCAQVDPAIFFPEKGGSTKSAKSVCRSCLVRASCLAEALSAPYTVSGIWGGTSELERRRINTRRPIAPAVCAIPKCDRPHDARGYCARHYNIIVRNAS